MQFGNFLPSITPITYSKQVYSAIKSRVEPWVSPVIQDSHLLKYNPEKIKVDGVEINYVKVGQGEPLVFVHGLSGNWEGWVPIIPYLEKNFCLYLLDLPGYGHSDGLDQYSISAQVHYLHGFIKKTCQTPKALIGASMGTLIVSELGDQFPDLAEKFILIGPVIRDNRLSKHAHLFRVFMSLIRSSNLTEYAMKKFIQNRFVAYALCKYINMHQFNKLIVDSYNVMAKKQMKIEAYTQMSESCAEYDLTPILETLKPATLLIFGSEDKISSPLYASAKIVGLNPSLSLVSIPEGGHIVALEKPREVAQVISEFLL